MSLAECPVWKSKLFRPANCAGQAGGSSSRPGQLRRRCYADHSAPNIRVHQPRLWLVSQPSPAKRYFGDVVLIDQNGEKLRLYEDLLKGRVVVMNAFYSDCQGVCSVLLPKLAELQTAAGLDDFYRSATAAGVHPFLLAPSTLAGRELLSAPDAFDGRVFCSFPALPSDRTPVGRDELMKLANDAHFSDGSFTRIALSSAKLLVHGLRQTGREVSREKLVDVLEHLSGYNSEQTPTVSFARDRRMGPDGVHVAGIDLQRKSPILPATWVLIN